MKYASFALIIICTIASVLGYKSLSPEEVARLADQADQEIWHLGQTNLKERLVVGTWLVFYGTKWCKFCKRLSPRWLRLQHQFADEQLYNHGFSITKVDCTAPADVWCANEYNVREYPTILLYRNGKQVEEYTGHHEPDAIMDYIKTQMKASGDDMAFKKQ